VSIQLVAASLTPGFEVRLGSELRLYDALLELTEMGQVLGRSVRIRLGNDHPALSNVIDVAFEQVCDGVVVISSEFLRILEARERNKLCEYLPRPLEDVTRTLLCSGDLDGGRPNDAYRHAHSLHGVHESRLR